MNFLLRRPPLPRGLGLAMILFCAGSCFQLHACDTDTCHGDDECSDGICDTDGFAIGAHCIPATECTSNAQCPTGNVCMQRVPFSADNPFASDAPGKKVCTCTDASFCV